MQNETEIKSCPFCGGEGLVLKLSTSGYYVECALCRSSTKTFKDKNKAIEQWNERYESNEILK